MAKHTDPPEWHGKRPEGFFARLAGVPILSAGVCGLCDAVRTALPPRLLELVALFVSAELECEYAFHGHTRIALDGGLLSYAEIAAAAVGPTAFHGPDAVLLGAVGELLSDDRLTRATRFALGDDTGVIVATGAYRLVASLMGATEPEPGVPPVPGLETPARARDTHAALTRADNDHADHPEAA